MKGFFRSKFTFPLITVVLLVTVLTSGLIGYRSSAHAASRSSHNIAYVNYDDSGFSDSWGGNIFATSIIGGPAQTTSTTAPVTYNGMTFTPLAKSAISSSTLANYDTLILFEVCDIATSLTSSQHTAINNYLAAGNKIILFDGDRCAPNAGGNADYSWFTYPFTTSNPGPQGATGTITIVENSTLTNGLASDPFNLDELGDANTATTSDSHWFAAAKTTNALGNNGYFLAYARNSGLIIYDGADHWATDEPTKSLTDLFLNELNQQYDPDNLPSSIPIAPTSVVRKAPYDFTQALSGLVNCNSSNTTGTGQANIDSDSQTGNLLVDLRARTTLVQFPLRKTKSGAAIGHAGVGIKYTAPQSGNINIGTDVVVAGFDLLTNVSVPKLGETAIVSLQSSVEISVTRINPTRDDVNTTDFAKRILTPSPDPIPTPLSFSLVQYFPPKTFTGSLNLSVTAGDQLYICVGIKSKVVAAGLLPWVGTAKVLYGSFPSGGTKVPSRDTKVLPVSGGTRVTRVKDIQITYV